MCDSFQSPFNLKHILLSLDPRQCQRAKHNEKKELLAKKLHIERCLCRCLLLKFFTALWLLRKTLIPSHHPLAECPRSPALHSAFRIFSFSPLADTWRWLWKVCHVACPATLLSVGAALNVPRTSPSRSGEEKGGGVLEDVLVLEFC